MNLKPETQHYNMQTECETRHLLAKKIQEIPPIEFSYETYYSHRKEQSSSKYNVGLLIPKSKKYIAWFTFLGEKDVCILLELNREKQIVQHKLINVVFDQTKPHLALGTFLYGSIFTPETSTTFPTYFVVEDIFMYKSVSLRKLCFGYRFAILSHILPEISKSDYSFVLPMMFDLSVYNQEKNVFPNISNILSQVCYPIHKIQYRSFTEIIPYMNYDLYLFTSKPEKIQAEYEVKDNSTKRGVQRNMSPEEYGQRAECLQPLTSKVASLPEKFGCGIRSGAEDIHPYSFSASSRSASDQTRVPNGICITKERDIFMVSADIQSDIYYLNHVHGKYRPDVAYIPNYKTSVFMNSLFRTIKENINLDTMEESDDEEEFQDIRMEKYVDLEKCIPMECMYHRKFKRWIPIRTLTSILG
jgi:hypothetical protein